MILLLCFAFLSGLATILAPCIWPLLPIILSSASLGKGHQRPLGITLGIMLSFAFFTLAISYLVKLFALDPNILRLLAVTVIGFLGLTMVIPSLSRTTEVLISKLTGVFGQQKKQGNDFGGGFITGLSLGIVWSPCAGPILASIATLAATGQVTWNIVIITVAYVTGTGIPLFIFAYGGQQIITKTRFISPYTEKLQRIFGVVMLLTAIAIYTNYDTYLQSRLLNTFPGFSTILTPFENNTAITNQLNLLKGSPKQENKTDITGLFNTNYVAPDLRGITKWLNTDTPLSLDSLKGKVVLVDFWTYTCINCLRTLPHVTSWYEKYKDKGLVVIGVHTPEFQFEHDTKNVLNAIEMYNIHYPVAQDNEYGTWNNYTNQYWPAEYLIDTKGNVRRTHFGEGEYDTTEMAIQALLKEAGNKITSPIDIMPDQTPHGRLSPETYLGAKRMQFYYPDGALPTGIQTFSQHNNLPESSFTLGGEWNILDEEAVTGKHAVLTYNFFASKVFLVLRPGDAKEHAKVKVFVDGKVVETNLAGADVQNGIVSIDTDRLYNLIDLKGKSGNHVLRLEFTNPGIEVFAFTFG